MRQAGIVEDGRDKLMRQMDTRFAWPARSAGRHIVRFDNNWKRGDSSIERIIYNRASVPVWYKNKRKIRPFGAIIRIRMNAGNESEIRSACLN